MNKLARAAVATLLFLALLVTIYVIHARAFHVDVVLYSTLVDVVIATAVAGAILWWLRYFSVLCSFEKAQLLVVWLLAGYAIAISGPTIIDRSFSFYLLEKMAQRGGGIQRSAFGDEVMDEFLREHRLIDARLTEQLESGTIQITGECVFLTAKGRRMAAASAAFRRHLLPRKRLLMGEYTDALTKPLEQPGGPRNVHYACEPAPAGGPSDG